MPIGLRTLLLDYDVTSAPRMGWGALENGELFAAAEAGGFDAMITADSNVRYQQNLTGRRLAPIVLSTNHWPTIDEQRDVVVKAVKASVPGGYTEVHLKAPPLRRRPFNPTEDC